MIVVITGATSGLGLALKEHFQNAGDTVISLARSIKSPSKTDIICDVSSRESLSRAFSQIKENFGRIDILINNAGVALFGATELLPNTEIDKIMDVNFYGTLFATKFALPLMTETSKIINISSPCGDFPLPFRTMYCVSKSAVSTLSYCMDLELKKFGVQVTAICPGNIFTNLSANRTKIYDTNSHYGNAIQLAGDKINAEASNRMGLDYVSAKVFRIIHKKHLKPQYVIGTKYKLLYFLARITPKSILFWGISKFSK